MENKKYLKPIHWPLALIVAVGLGSMAHGAGAANATATGDIPPVTQQLQQWLQGPVQVKVRNEVSGTAASFESKPASPTAAVAASAQALAALGLSVSERFSMTERGMVWDLEFSGQGARVGHEVTIELPLLTGRRQVFTPSDRGVMALSAYPTFAPAEYGRGGYANGRCYVLPLVSVLEPQTDNAMTIALPADTNIPHLQVDWLNAKTLRLRLGHRGMGGGKPSPLRLLFYTHPADYRAAIRAYSDDFPRYFRPPQPRGPYEGAFWYHHIQAHPSFEEMARQNIRYIWTSFWFTHLGEYLPAAPEWEPYSYARIWNLKEMMNDGKINAFIANMHAHDIGVYAYFNVTEYGGKGGRSGDTETAGRILREQFSNALIKDAKGQSVPTWEGAMAMNARHDYSLFPALAEQLRRHVTRLPKLDGFIIDRLDWASRIDHGHDDGLTMIGNRPVENMAGPVAEGIAEVCRQAHAAGWRVFVNQFYRIEVLRDNDGYCQENDAVRWLGYVSPFRPVSAWHYRKPYTGSLTYGNDSSYVTGGYGSDKGPRKVSDLLQFEGQLKRRLQFAVFPQMVAHEFPLIQQAPDTNAADLLELYAPLFALLDGKEQVLQPHCISVTGVNDVNLFVNRAGHYVATVTSRVRFLSRRATAKESVQVRLNVTNAASVAWAYVVSADGPPYWATVTHLPNAAEIAFDRHETASMVVAGSGPQPALPPLDTQRLQIMRDRLFPSQAAASVVAAPRPELGAIQSATLLVNGVNLGDPGFLMPVMVDNQQAGVLNDGDNSFPVELAAGKLSANPPRVQLTVADEGTWFAPQRVELLVTLANGKRYRVATWTPQVDTTAADGFNSLVLPLTWQAAEEVKIVRSAARLDSRDTSSGGQWKGRLGKQAAWIPNVTNIKPQNGYELLAGGKALTWPGGTNDSRALEVSAGKASDRRASCWHSTGELSFGITPPNPKPYRLTVYLLDFDRNGRALEAQVSDAEGSLDRQTVSPQETAGGVYLTWIVSGKVNLGFKKTAGYNAVASGIFIDTVE